MNRDDRKVFLHAGLIAAAVVICATLAHADEPIPCWQAKALVAWAGNEAVAEKIARKRGYTRAQIEDAKRRCRA